MTAHRNTAPDAALQLLAKAAVALRPYGEHLVVAGGLVPLLYRSLPQFRQTDWAPLRTFDVDLTLPRQMARGQSAPALLLEAGIVCVHGRGTAGAGAEYFQDAAHGETQRNAVYLEFLTSKKGDGATQFATLPIGLRVQTLRYLELLRIEPLTLDLQHVPEAGLTSEAIVRLPQPVTFILQKPLIRRYRASNKRPKDMAYVYDVVTLSRPEWQTAARIVADVREFGGEHAVWAKKALKELGVLFGSVTADGVVETRLALAGTALEHTPSANAVFEAVQDWLAVVGAG